jgi:hypothetical protein
MPLPQQDSSSPGALSSRLNPLLNPGRGAQNSGGDRLSLTRTLASSQRIHPSLHGLQVLQSLDLFNRQVRQLSNFNKGHLLFQQTTGYLQTLISRT